MRIVFLGVVALTLLHWSNAECPSSLSLNVITCQPEEDIGVCIRNHLKFGGNGCISVPLSEGTYYLSERFEVVNRSVSITSTGLGVSVVCNLSSTFSQRAVFSVKEAEFAELKGVNFSSCSHTVEFVRVRTVNIIGATFDSFSGSGAVNVFNCDEVFVEDCVFQNSTSTNPVTEDSFRGSSGGLSISSNNPNPPPLSFTITNTIFRNLTSLISRDKIRNSQDNDAYFRSFQGRGGGVSVIVNNSTEMGLLVTNCTFSSNNATLNGGGLYLFVRHLSAGLNMTVSNNSFTNNMVTLSANASINNGGGAVGVTLYEGSAQEFTNSVQLLRNVFVGNKATYSGALFIVSATVSAASSVDILVKDSLFTDNHALFSGAAITISAPVRLTLDGNEKMTLGTPQSPILQDIVCMNNRALSGGVVFTSSYSVVFEGRNVFFRNNGPALRIISSRITVGGELYFQGNSAVDSEGGAMYISNGEIRLKNGSSVIFEDNEGSFGAAIVSEPIYTLSNYIKSPFNPLCFISYEDSSLLVEQWDGVEIIFASNRALVGSAVYSEEIGLCSHHGRNLTFTTAGVLTSDPPFVYSDNTNRRHPDPYDPSWQLSTPVARFEIKCRVESVRNSPASNCTKVQAYPGERVFLDIAAYSELGHRTYGLFSLQVNNSNQDQISVYPPLYSVYPNSRECPFIFSYKRETSLSSFHVVVESNAYSSSNTLDLLPVQVIQIQITPCPVGHVISKETGQCVCQFSERLLICDANRLILKSGYWGMSVKNESSEELITFKCPTGYCRCIFDFQPNQTFTTFSGCDTSSLSPTVSGSSSTGSCDALFDVFAPNDQCSCNRTGYLCGSCRDGYAVTALLSRCRECPDVASIIIIILIILDAAAMIVLCTLPVFIKRFHFPSSMYALLFYVQIAPYATDDFPLSHERFYQVLRYLGSLLGLYFPYDVCLSGSTTALRAYATRYIPFLVSLVVMPTVIGVMWCFRKKVKMTYNGIWFVWMLILNDLLATSFSILNCPILPDENGSLHSVWYYDGTVKCFDDRHAVLGIWAIIVLLLVFGAMVMILVVMYPTERLKFRQAIQKITEPVVIGFSEEYPFWFFIDFLSRFLFIAVVVYEKDSESAGIFVLSLIIIVNAYFKPYRTFSDNLLQLIILGAFLTLLLLRQTSFSSVSRLNSFITDTPTNSAVCSGAYIKFTWISAVLGIWYCLPVLLFAMPLAVAVVRKFRGRCAFLFRKKRQIQKKIETFKRSNRVVTTELAVFSPLIVENQQASLSEDNERDWEEKPKDEEQHEGELKEKKVSSSGSIINATITCSDL